MHKIKRQRALLDKIVHTHQIFPGLRKVRKTYKHILPLHLDSSSFVVIPQVTTVFFVIRMNSGVHEFDKTTEPPPKKKTYHFPLLCHCASHIAPNSNIHSYK